MKHLIQLMIVYISRFFLRIFYIFPVKDNRLLFLSYGGKQYSCNPKYISKYIAENYPDKFEIIWVYNDLTKAEEFKAENIKIVKIYSFMYFLYSITSRVIINNNNFSAFIPLRKKQYVINTWHGGGAYKKSGNDVPNFNKFYKKILQIGSDRINCFLSSSSMFSEVFVRSGYLYKGFILGKGMPRNDIFFKNYEDIISRAKEYYSLPDDTKILLYAPTHRDDKPLTDYHFDYENVLKALKNKFGGKWVIMFRAHYMVSADLEKNFISSNIINASGYPDMQELLCAADVLVTDYSSSIWDFSFTGKPCILYATDVDLYKTEHQFYIDIHEWPFPLSENNQQLIYNIEHFNQEKYNEDVKRHHDRLGSYETGQASKAISEIIYNVCYENERQVK